MCLRRLQPWAMRWGLAGLLAAAGAGPARADEREGPLYTGCAAQTAPIVNADFEQQVVELVNQRRLENGNLSPLKRVDELDRAARYHAEDMRAENYFDHNTYDGGVLVCAWNVRVGQFYTGVRGENIAWGYGSPASVMTGWMNSSGHRANILNTGHREIGVGYAAGNRWVQDFGARSGQYPLVINREAAQTASRAVSLYLYKGTGSANWTHMRLKNDTDADYGAWQPFQNDVAWTLGPAGGLRTVTVQYSANGGASVGGTASDSILLNLVNQMTALPATGAFLFGLATGQMSPARLDLVLDNAGGGGALTWTASQTGGWFTLSAAGGTTPATLSITPAQPNGPPQTFTGAVTVTVSSPAGVDNAVQRVDLSLAVVDQALRLYLPSVGR
mgnify:CR=1 FL=1